MCQYIQDSAKTVQKGKFIANVCIRKKERSQINNSSSYFTKLGERSKINLKEAEGRK